MTNEMDRFRQTFFTESFELLEDMEERLLGLDGSAGKEELNAIFRCAHSIKGSAGIFGFEAITHFTHILETLLDGMREGRIAVTPDAIQALLQARDIVLKMVQAAKDNSPLPADCGDEVAQTLQQLSGGSSAVKAMATASVTVKAEQETIYHIHFAPHRDVFTTGNEPLNILRELHRIGKADVICHSNVLPALDALEPHDCYLSWDITLASKQDLAAVKEVFEFIENACELKIDVIETASAPAAATAPAEKSTVSTGSPSANTEKPKSGTSSIRVDIEKLDRLVNLVGEVVITQTMLTSQSRQLPIDQYSTLLHGIEELAQHARELQEAVMGVRMQPVKSIFSRMPRLVHDVAAKLGKNIRLNLAGENTEVDKTVIEQLGDPLTHMIRNSMDHGIEKPEERKAAGKPEQGTIHLEASHRGGRIIIEVSDDGGGINRSKVLQKAKEKGLVAADAQLSDEEIDRLIFAPGFSTADVVSDLSGRGVGMDVVRRNIEAIGGIVSIHNQPGIGTSFSISLPLTLAILDAMIVRVGQEHYIIPIANIRETLRPALADIRRTPDGAEMIHVRGEFLPVLHLSRVFGVKTTITEANKGLVVLVESGSRMIGLVVDELIGQQQVVIKTLEANTDPVQGIAGATILGDGRVSLILDIPALQIINQSKTYQLAS